MKTYEQISLNNNPRICVDFDGVIHSYTSGWEGVDVINDPPVDGAIEWLMTMLPSPEEIDPFGLELREFVEKRKPVAMIYSSRSKSSKGVKAMKNWLVKHGLPKSYIRDNILEFPTEKPAAFLTIDDRAICFKGIFPNSEEIMKFRAWNK